MVCFENSHLSRLSMTFACSSLSKTYPPIVFFLVSSVYQYVIDHADNSLETADDVGHTLLDVLRSGGNAKREAVKAKPADWCNESDKKGGFG